MSRKAVSRSRKSADIFLPEDHVVMAPVKKEFKPYNEAQKSYVSKIRNNILTFAIGPAGTGKTMCAAAIAAEYYNKKIIDRIIITRPAVEAGEQLGFLPGNLQEKYMPYVAPIMECLSKLLGKSQVEYMVKAEKILFLPLAYARGWTFEKSFVILDEAQNVTSTQMKLFLTRIGEDSKVVVDGDISQKDIHVRGLEDALDRLAGVANIAVQRFTNSDIVRSGISKDIVVAYSDDESDNNNEGLNRYLKK